ncbi:MAG TPA: hypothetical protein VFT29_04720 [Gemmatimonadaceae bacterium]|nr:hypothetical protein [Gemmatimonadaceae bacterium]
MRRRRGLYWLLLILSTLSAYYCFWGVVMNGHFGMLAHSSASAASHLLAARVFLGLTFVALVVVALSLVGLWRTRLSRQIAIDEADGA